MCTPQNPPRFEIPSSEKTFHDDTRRTICRSTTQQCGAAEAACCMQLLELRLRRSLYTEQFLYLEVLYRTLAAVVRSAHFDVPSTVF